MRRLKKICSLLIVCFCITMLSACSSGGDSEEYPSEYPASPPIKREEIKFPQFPQTTVLSDNATAIIDFSNASQGYIGAQRLTNDDTRIKIRVEKDGKIYNHDLIGKDWNTYPLQMGSGTYTLVIFKNLEGKSYARVAQTQIEVNLESEVIPFLYPNQVVDYKADSQVVDLSFELTKDDENVLQRIKTLYEFVLDHLDYDNTKAKNVTNVYVLPDLDEALAQGDGICFDYASLLAALCRIQGIPARVITGETEIEYHAWVEVYVEGKGWINPKYEFDAKSWTMMDPTFDDSRGDYEGAYEEVFRY